MTFRRVYAGRSLLVGDPYKLLATAVIHFAVQEWKKHPKMRAELREFFDGEWFLLLADVAGVAVDRIWDRKRKRIRV